MNVLSQTTSPANILDILDGRRAQIIFALMEGTQRFGQLRVSTGLSQKTLSANLHVLESAGLLVRKVYAEVPLRVEYTLTENGYSLRSILDTLGRWSEEHFLIVH